MCKPSECVFIETGYWIDKSKNIFKRNEFTMETLIDSFVNKRNNIGIFKTAYTYDTTNQNEAYLYANFYLDFDSSDFELARDDTIRALSYLKIVFNINIDKETRIFFSGNKGFHIVVSAKALGIEPDKNLNCIFKSIARKVKDYLVHKTLDMRIYDNKRLFRVENSKHEKSGLYKVNLTNEMLRNWSEAEIKEYAKERHKIAPFKCSLNVIANKMYKDIEANWQKELEEFENKKNDRKKVLKHTPPCIKNILENGAISGQRNNTIAILAGFYNASEKELKTALKEIYDWNVEKNSIPTSKGETYNTIKSIYNSDTCFGCTSIRDLDLCVEGECKFKKNIQ